MKSKKFLICVIILAVLVGLVVIAYAVLFHAGKREWVATKAALEARGELLAVKVLKPLPIPEAGNFYALPLFREEIASGGTWSKSDSPAGRVRSWEEEFRPFSTPDIILNRRTDWVAHPNIDSLRRGIADLQPILDQVRAGRNRPRANGDLPWEQHFRMPLAHVMLLLNLGKALRSSAALAIGDKDPALALGELETLIRVAEAGFQEPLLISNLIGVSNGFFAISVLWEGLESGTWDEQQLERLQELLDRFPPPRRSFAQALRMERAMFNDTVLPAVGNPAKLTELIPIADGSIGMSPSPKGAHIGAYLIPSGFIYSEVALYNKLVQELIDCLEQQAVLRGPTLPNLGWTHPLARLPMHSLAGTVESAALFEAYLRMARLAIALKRWQLKHGSYPESLETLAPEHPAGLPMDPVAGEPFRYRRTNPQQFELWSIGWDRVDDNATPYNRSTKIGDWVWRSGF